MAEFENIPSRSAAAMTDSGRIDSVSSQLNDVVELAELLVLIPSVPWR